MKSKQCVYLSAASVNCPVGEGVNEACFWKGGILLEAQGDLKRN